MADSILPNIAALLAHLDPTTNPFRQGQAFLKAALYPATRSNFHAQIYFLLALFGSVILVILAGLVMRIIQGRFWLLRRIRGFILMPNTSVCYGLFALAYLSLGILNLAFSLEISNGTTYPRPYIGFLGAWSSFLWLGMWTELWTTLCGLAFRKYGMGNEDSPAKLTTLAFLSILVPFAAITPPIVLMALANVDFNIVLGQYEIISGDLALWASEWVPGSGLDAGKLAGIIPSAETLGEYLIAYSWKARCGYYYAAAVFLLTFVAYIVVVGYAIANLKVSAGQLRGDVPLPDARVSGSLGTSTSGATKDIEQLLHSEWFSGAGRQASLLEWVAVNRTWTAVLMGAMMLENIGLSLCYMNGALQGLVSLLILVRSLDGSSPLVRNLKRAFPFLPLPPAVGLRGGTETIFHHSVDFVSEVEMQSGGKEGVKECA